MKRYSKKSQIRKINLIRSAKKEVFTAEIVKDPSSNIKLNNLEKALDEISRLVKRGWGEFSPEYLKTSILHSHYLLFLRNKKDQLIGVAPIKKIDIDDHYIYSFGLTVVDPDYQGLSFMKKMHLLLGRRVFMENLLKGKFAVEFVFITPNFKTIGALAKIADFIYPNPYLIDEKTGKVKDADEETWNTVQQYLKESGETYRILDKNGSVMVGFYDDKPHLIIKDRRRASDKKLDLFSQNYLKPGNEVVVRAKVGLGGILRSGF